MSVTDDHSETNLQGVVRRYSEKITDTDPDNTLSQALGVYFQQQDVEQQKRTQPEHNGYIPHSLEERSELVTVRLEDQRKRLTDMWQKFHSHFKLGDAELEGNIPSISNILANVENAEKAWSLKKTSGAGKAKEGIVNFFNKMNDHSFLFSVIPDRDKYTSLITGVVSSIMKMSVHHKRNSQGFSEALIKIGRDLATIPKSTKISNTPEMIVCVVDFYIEVFDFLCHSIEWYQSRRIRFRASLNENFYDDNVEHRVSNIREALGRVRLEAEQTTQQSVKNVEKGVQNVKQDISEIKTQLKDSADFMREMERMQRMQQEQGVELQIERVMEKVLLKLSNGVFQTLMSNGQHLMHDLKYGPYKSIESSDHLQIGESCKEDLESLAKFTRSDIEEHLSS